MSKKSKNQGAESGKEYHDEVANVIGGVIAHLEKVFTKVYVEGPPLDPAKIQESPLMFVSTHRSHVDYFLVGSYFVRMGFRNLRFAAGDNLTKLPWIGPKFLAFGAFSVSRDAGFDRNYVRNLCKQVVAMLDNGDAVLVFPEGGRSYTGAMLDIRGGILNAALMLQAANPDRDVYLLPAAVSYECPPDAPHFPMLLKGKNRRKKSNNIVRRFVGAIYYFGADILAFGPFMFFKRRGRYGAAYMDYAAPVPVRALVDLAANRVQGARDEFAAHRASLDIVGEHMRKQFVSIFRILPVHVVSSIIKEGGEGIGTAHLESYAETRKKSLAGSGRNCKTLNSMTPHEIVQAGIKQLVKLKAITTEKGEGKVSVRKRHLIEYFAAAVDAEEPAA
ncbi:MAG: 1-acyl-sn-glycerol-3-phosphate acyltransferase [Chitinispirillia bacterium]|nr:1-acyl-sn-glycerol-3-phosphate acyltransferase [Chitinispirillia bacterium]MCL2267762.1 1-acyl-sn-glycerol-3-phosphate acyltransferase [Chitinispirillia bacterium]